jgi:hypothetical protein
MSDELNAILLCISLYKPSHTLNDTNYGPNITLSTFENHKIN